MAYGLGRHVGEPLVKALTGKTLQLDHKQSETTLGLLIFVTRLLPVVSFDLVSYGAGMPRLPLPMQAGATLFGMVPSTFLLNYMGDRIHVSGSTVWLLSALFIVLFLGLPLLVYRYNWLDVRSLLSRSQFTVDEKSHDAIEQELMIVNNQDVNCLHLYRNLSHDRWVVSLDKQT